MTGGRTRYSPLGPSNSTPWYLSKRNECVCPQKALYKHFHSSFIHNSLKLETTQINEQNGQTNWYFFMQWLSSQNEAVTDIPITCMNLNNTLLSEADTEEYIL